MKRKQKETSRNIICEPPFDIKCKRPFLDAFLYLKGIRNKEGKETWPVCASCRPVVMERYRSRE